MTLLEKAIDAAPKKCRSIYTDEELELALGYIRGTIGTGQIQQVIGKRGHTNCYSWIAPRVRMAFARGMIKDA